MANAEEVQLWINALNLLEKNQIKDAITNFEDCAPNSKILFNIACCCMRLKDLDRAREKLQEAIEKDPHSAIAHFLLGQLKYSSRNFHGSLECYKSAYSGIRGKKYVDYRPLGLKFVLHGWQILANQAMVCSKLNSPDVDYYMEEAFQMADSEQEKELHAIKNAIQSNASLLKHLIKFRPDVLFKPPNDSMNNVKKKDYLGKAKVVSTENKQEIYSAFSGTQQQKLLSSSTPQTSRKSVSSDRIPPPPIAPPPPPMLPPTAKSHLSQKSTPSKPPRPVSIQSSPNANAAPVKPPPPVISKPSEVPAKSNANIKPPVFKPPSTVSRPPSALSKSPSMAMKLPPTAVKLPSTATAPLSSAIKPQLSGKLSKPPPPPTPNTVLPKQNIKPIPQKPPQPLKTANSIHKTSPKPALRKDIKSIEISNPEPLWKKPIKPPSPAIPISTTKKPNPNSPIPKPKARPCVPSRPQSEVVTTTSNARTPFSTRINSDVNNNNNSSYNNNNIRASVNNNNNNNNINKNLNKYPKHLPAKTQPNRPPPPLAKIRSSSFEEHLYEDPEMVYKSDTFNSLSRKSSSLEDIPKLEKSIYGNIFTEVCNTTKQRVAPTAQLPVLTEAAKNYHPTLPNNKPQKPLPTLNLR